MQLIIKPTGKCNFRCTFCSAYGMNVQHPENNRVPEQLKNLIGSLNPDQIIATGGEPLLVEPEYYYELHDIFPGDIHVTSNLREFYRNPEKWTPLFKEPWFSVVTSFNYGDKRVWTINPDGLDVIYSESKFLAIMDKFQQHVGFLPEYFIAIIDPENERRVLDHIELAHRLHMKVKMNGLLNLGLSTSYYPRYKMFRHYMTLIALGLDKYEVNCCNRHIGGCPFNIDLMCSSTIRACYIDMENVLHCAACDDEVVTGIMMTPEEIVPKHVKPEILKIDDYISPKCLSCDLSRLCNGCRGNRKLAKTDPIYCDEMMKLKDQIISSGWKL